MTTTPLGVSTRSSCSTSIPATSSHGWTPRVPCSPSCSRAPDGPATSTCAASRRSPASGWSDRTVLGRYARDRDLCVLDRPGDLGFVDFGGLADLGVFEEDDRRGGMTARPL